MAKRWAARGSEQWTAEDARGVIEGWERSGQSGSEYARSIGVIPQRLFWWRRRLAAGSPRRRAAATLIPVTVRGVAAATATAPVVVTTATGTRIDVNEVDAATAEWVAAVLNGGRS